ncbi:hypothetical protein Tco_0236009 [Tanacetum coccineum]
MSLPHDVMSTSDRRLIELKNQVQRMMEAQIAHKTSVQVNKITSSEIFSGPYDTKYCMEIPEQTFIDYESSRNNEVGGLKKEEEEKPETPKVEKNEESSIINKDDKSSDSETYEHETNILEEKEWTEYKQPLDLVNTLDESVYESLIDKMPSCLLNFNFRIEKGSPNNLKIPCMIRHKYIANAYIDLDLPMNVMSLPMIIPLGVKIMNIED